MIPPLQTFQTHHIQHCIDSLPAKGFGVPVQLQRLGVLRGGMWWWWGGGWQRTHILSGAAGSVSRVLSKAQREQARLQLPT